MTSAKQYLQLTEVKSLLQAQDLISVTTETPVGDAMATLLDHRIQSVPVFDPEKKRFYTFVDTLDIATHVTKVSLFLHRKENRRTKWKEKAKLNTIDSSAYLSYLFFPRSFTF